LEVISKIESLSEQAPFTPGSSAGIHAVEKCCPEAKPGSRIRYAFHQDGSRLRIHVCHPYELFVKYDIRRYGFTGPAPIRGKKGCEFTGLDYNTGKSHLLPFGQRRSVTV
jgi:acetate kinase